MPKMCLTVSAAVSLTSCAPDSTQVLRVLHIQRLVESVSVSVFGDDLGGDVLAPKHGADRVSRHDAQQKEDDGQKDEHHRNRQQNALDNVSADSAHDTSHGSVAQGCASIETRDAPLNRI